MSDPNGGRVSRRTALKSLGAAALGAIGVSGAASSATAASKTTLEFALWATKKAEDEWNANHNQDSETYPVDFDTGYQEIAERVEMMFEPIVEATTGLTDVEVKTSAFFHGHDYDQWWNNNKSGSVDRSDIDAYDEFIQDKHQLVYNSGIEKPALDGNMWLTRGEKPGYGSAFSGPVNYLGISTGDVVSTDVGGSPPTWPRGWCNEATTGEEMCKLWHEVDGLLGQPYGYNEYEGPLNVDNDYAFEDVDGDGDVDFLDAVKLDDYRKQGGLTGIHNRTLDIDDDGDLDNADVTYLANNYNSINSSRTQDRPMPLVAGSNPGLKEFNTLVHEFGHCIYLDHNYNPNTGYKDLDMDVWDTDDFNATVNYPNGPNLQDGDGDLTIKSIMTSSNYPSGVNYNGTTNDFGETLFDGSAVRVMTWNDKIIERAASGEAYTNTNDQIDLYVYGVNKNVPAGY